MKVRPCSEQTFFNEVNGHVTTLKDLDRFKFVDQDRIIFFGHSMGGLTAPRCLSGSSLRGYLRHRDGRDQLDRV